MRTRRRTVACSATSGTESRPCRSGTATPMVARHSPESSLSSYSRLRSPQSRDEPESRVPSPESRPSLSPSVSAFRSPIMRRRSHVSSSIHISCQSAHTGVIGRCHASACAASCVLVRAGCRRTVQRVDRAGRSAGISHRRVAESEHVQALSGAGAHRRSRRHAVSDRHAQRQHSRDSRSGRSALRRFARRDRRRQLHRGPHGIARYATASGFAAIGRRRGHLRRDAARPARSRRHLVPFPGRHRLPALRPSRRNAGRRSHARPGRRAPLRLRASPDRRALRQHEGSDQPGDHQPLFRRSRVG